MFFWKHVKKSLIFVYYFSIALYIIFGMVFAGMVVKVSLKYWGRLVSTT